MTLPRLRNVSHVLSLGHMVGERIGQVQPISVDTLKACFGRFGWKPMFLRLARIASLLANGPGFDHDDVRAPTHGLLLALRASPVREEREIAAYVSRHAGNPIATETTIYFAEACALIYGRDTDDDPGDAMVAFVLLACNDFAFDWARVDGRTLSREERVLADTVRVALFNQRRDVMSFINRSAIMLSFAPKREPRWLAPEAWAAIVRGALGGLDLDAYLATVAIPLASLSVLWGRRSESGQLRSPLLAPKTWFAKAAGGASAAEPFVSALTSTRDEARTALNAGLDQRGLPVGTALFYRKPFVRFGDDELVAASPWVVREQLRGGLWGRMRRAAVDDDAKGGADRWLRAFGEIFERWCRNVAEVASASPRFPHGLILSPDVGVDEIADVVLVSRNRRSVILFAVKASTIPESRLKWAQSREAVVDWFDRFLIVRAKGSYGDGALRKMADHIEKIRRGEHAPRIRRDATVYPVVVTYDELGLDQVGGYEWLEWRTVELGDLPRDSGTRRVTFMNASTYEEAMAAAAHGHSLITLLETKTRREWKDAGFDALLHERVPDHEQRRLPGATERFKRLIADVVRRVSGATTESGEAELRAVIDDADTEEEGAG